MNMTVPPDATAEEGTSNDQRASWAEAALQMFSQRTGTPSVKEADAETRFLLVADFQADLAHWCDRHQVDLQAATQQATKHYQRETAFEGVQLP